ncbi:MAG: hypothetical protein ABL883_14780 [Terricaulis sp.]
MRILALFTTLALSSCAASTTTTLAPADAATALIAGERITMARAATSSGQDPQVILTLTHADGRAMRFEEANHTPHDVMAQAPAGPLSQIMGFFGDETPVLYSARAAENAGTAFVCAPEGPVSIGVYAAPDGDVQIVGLKESFQFEERDDGAAEALPYSPDHVCARLRFTQR